MGCVSSKKARSQSPAFDEVCSSSASAGRSSRPGRLASSGSVHVQAALGSLEKIKEEPERETDVEDVDEELRKNGPNVDDNLEDLRAAKRSASQKKSVFTIKFGRLAESEHVNAGWPAWLTAVAGEAIEGWEPLKSDAFERLEKEVKTVGNFEFEKHDQFDIIEGECNSSSARFEALWARKFIGKIGQGTYSTVYRARELKTGLFISVVLGIAMACSSLASSCLKMLFSKIADFGLANFMRPKNKQPLTSRVVTLWYRPPELLLGSTNYAESVDLWSIGCVFAELFIGRPLLKARTEVEQLHKIFKLCGSPPDDYWKRSKLPLAAMFKPQQPYESTLRERCKEFPKSAVSLIETFLSIEPHKRGTAASALESEYFTTKPYACDPSSMPKYPPNKEIDAKIREDARRKKSSVMARAEGGPRNPRRLRKTLQESTDFCKVIPAEEVEMNAQVAHRTMVSALIEKEVELGNHQLNPAYDTKSDASQGSQTTQASQGTSIHSLPEQVTTSNSFAWAKRRKQPDVFTRLHSQPTQSSNQRSIALEPSNMLHVHDTLEPDGQQNHDSSGRIYGAETARRPTRREQAHLRRPESFDSSDIYEPQELPEDYGNKKKGRVGYSGTLTSQEIAERQHDLPRQVHRSRFYID
ncbi:UNVERIFIED_CONTAM: protein IMPAIRED IN BABA-INDUCED STERILITY 1 [Sesamum radiatum]|uniref:Protein IMPAIRED IN BABA-INDUCED STERILITY 1 n=1 Tax=Sesamum radiatum TaxID=300843 RepID=A0AAW2P4V8_SESRA